MFVCDVIPSHTSVEATTGIIQPHDAAQFVSPITLGYGLLNFVVHQPRRGIRDSQLPRLSIATR